MIRSGRELNPLIDKSVFILREVKARFKNPAILWSTGKDSTCTIHMAKFQAFNGELDWPVIHMDTGYKFPEIYEFREKLAKDWNLNLVIAKNESTKLQQNHLECCFERKTLALKNLFVKNKYDAIIVSIRWDEHPIRGMERYFSPRDHKWHWNVVREKSEDEMKEGDAPYVSLTDTELAGWNIYATDFGPECSHVRVHPILHWTEVEMWCVPSNTLIISEKGCESIEDIVNSDSELVMSQLGYSAISHKCVTEATALAEIASETGRKVSVTPGNPVMTNRGWLLPEQIKEGDELIVLSNEVDSFGFNAKTNQLKERLAGKRGKPIERIVANSSTGTTQRETSRSQFEGDAMESQSSRSKTVGRHQVLDKICTYSAYRNGSGIYRWNNRWGRYNIPASDEKRSCSLLPQCIQHLSSSVGLPFSEVEHAFFKFQNEGKSTFWKEKDCWANDQQYAENQRYSSGNKPLLNCQEETRRVCNGIYHSANWERMLRTFEREANRFVSDGKRIKLTSERTARIQWKFGLQKVYDLTTSAGAFFANNILIHNSYMKLENIPFNPLYLSNGKTRYRSLGCMPCTKPIKSTASNIDEIIEELMLSKTAERAGRLNTKEDNMQKLRMLGYM